MSKAIRDIIHRHSIFSLLPDNTQNELAGIGKTFLFKAKEKLIREGKFNPYLFLLINGTVEIESPNETPITISGHKILGEISATGMGSPVADVIATSHVIAIAFPVDVIANVLTKHDNFAKRIRDLGMKQAEHYFTSS
ncbi:MAG: cyclic nucleotide-binding domain-containing protein [Mariprofundaceae bacterium]